MLPVGTGEKSKPLLRTTSAELLGMVSPDGRWLAYLSDETGRFEVYVQSFPVGGRKVQVTMSGTAGARSSQSVIWLRRDGRQLGVIATVNPHIIVTTWTADLQRALTIVPESGAAAWSLTFVRPWTAAIGRR